MLRVRDIVVTATVCAAAMCMPAHAERTLEHEAVIPAPVADVWEASHATINVKLSMG